MFILNLILVPNKINQIYLTFFCVFNKFLLNYKINKLNKILDINKSCFTNYIIFFMMR